VKLTAQRPLCRQLHIECEADGTAGVVFPNNFSHIPAPNPDKPELNIEYCRLKIYGIASLCLFYDTDRLIFIELKS
jgi:hypothetical protein